MIAVAFLVQLLACVFLGTDALVTHRTSKGPKKDFAIVTLIAGESCIQGSQVLGCSLRNFAASRNIELLALCYDLSPGVRKLAYESGWTCIDHAEHVPNPDPHSKWSYDYTVKIAPFALTQYRRVLVLDSDTVVVNPNGLLSLFRRPLPEGHIMAAMDCFTPFVFGGKLQHSKAAPQVQAGAIVLEPSLKMHEDLKAAVPTTFSLDKGGQGFISEFFQGKVQPLEAKFDYIRATFCMGLINKNGFYDLDGNATAHDMEVANEARHFSLEDAEAKASRDIESGQVVIAHFQAHPKPWECYPDPERQATCGMTRGFFGNTGIDALYHAWLDVADTCNLNL